MSKPETTNTIGIIFFIKSIMRHKIPYSFIALLLSAPILMATPILLTGCTLELANTKPAREIRTPVQADGDLYAGWRVFQDKCASCHGVAAVGSDRAPNLLRVIGGMPPRQFAALVLKRYDLGSGVARGVQDSSTLEVTVDEIMRRSEAPIEMPEWQSEPAVNAHILDLYTYLAARAEGKLGVERPQH
jgi:hypothetical protein